MQRVARSVAWENKHLRGLLHLRGVSQDEVDHHLFLAAFVGSSVNQDSWESLQIGIGSSPPHGQSEREQPDPSPGDTSADFPSLLSTPSSNSPSLMPSRLLETSVPPRASLPNDTPLPGRREAVDCPVTISHGRKTHDPHDTHTIENGERINISSIHNDGWTELGTQADILPQVTECFCPPSSPVYISGHWDKGLSCQAAVEIISGLQKTMDSDRIRHLLHCKEADDCLVHNSRVFQVIDTLA